MVSRSEGRPSSSPRNRIFFARPSPGRRAPNPLRWVVGLASCLASPRGGVSYIKSCTFARRRGCWQCYRYGFQPPYVTEEGIEPSNVADQRVEQALLHSFVPIHLERYLGDVPPARGVPSFRDTKPTNHLTLQSHETDSLGCGCLSAVCIAFTRALWSRRSELNRLKSQVA